MYDSITTSSFNSITIFSSGPCSLPKYGVTWFGEWCLDINGEKILVIFIFFLILHTLICMIIQG